MGTNGIHVNGSSSSRRAEIAELTKELAHLRTRLAEITSFLRREYGNESAEARLCGDVSTAVQKLEAKLHGCASARFES